MRYVGRDAQRTLCWSLHAFKDSERFQLACRAWYAARTAHRPTKQKLASRSAPQTSAAAAAWCCACVRRHCCAAPHAHSALAQPVSGGQPVPGGSSGAAAGAEVRAWGPADGARESRAGAGLPAGADPGPRSAPGASAAPQQKWV